MRLNLALANLLSAAAMAVASGVASAQTPTTDDAAGDMVRPGLNDGVKGYYFTDSERTGPRVYGYTSYGDDEVGSPPARMRRDRDRDDGPRYRGGCGTYRYWNGDRCVDSRDR